MQDPRCSLLINPAWIEWHFGHLAEPETRPAYRIKPKRAQLIAWTRTQGRCFYCGIHTERTGDASNRRQFCVDHLVPQDPRQDDDPDNLVPACRWCNTSKGKKPLEVWRVWLMDHYGHPGLGWFEAEGDQP